MFLNGTNGTPDKNGDNALKHPKGIWKEDSGEIKPDVNPELKTVLPCPNDYKN